jgi:hypothetical protein
VKRQAVIEIQRAVAAAESRAVEMIAQERVKMEKIFTDMNRSTTDLTTEPVIEVILDHLVGVVSAFLTFSNFPVQPQSSADHAKRK